MSDWVGTNIGDLRSYGERVVDKGGQAKSLELHQAFNAVFLPESETALALIESAEVLEKIAAHTHGRFTFAGAESKTDADHYQSLQECHDEQFQAVGEAVEDIGKFRW